MIMLVDQMGFHGLECELGSGVGMTVSPLSVSPVISSLVITFIAVKTPIQGRFY